MNKAITTHTQPIEKSKAIFNVFILKQLADRIRLKLKELNILLNNGESFSSDDDINDMIQKFTLSGESNDKTRVIQCIKQLMDQCEASKMDNDKDIIKRFLTQEYRNGIEELYTSIKTYDKDSHTSFVLKTSEDIFEVFTLKQFADPIREQLKPFGINRNQDMYLRRNISSRSNIDSMVEEFLKNGNNKDKTRVIQHVKELMDQCETSKMDNDKDIIKRFLTQEYRNKIKNRRPKESDYLWEPSVCMEIHVDLQWVLFGDHRINFLPTRNLFECLSDTFGLPVKLITNEHRKSPHPDTKEWAIREAKEMVGNYKVKSEATVEVKSDKMPLIYIGYQTSQYSPIVLNVYNSR